MKLTLKDLSAVTEVNKRKLAKSVCDFIDIAVTATGRSTFYNSDAAQAEAEAKVHDELIKRYYEKHP